MHRGGGGQKRPKNCVRTIRMPPIKEDTYLLHSSEQFFSLGLAPLKSFLSGYIGIALEILEIKGCLQMCCIKNGGPRTLSKTPEKTLIVCLLITHLLSGSDWGSSIPLRPLSTPCPVWNLFNGTIVTPYGPYSRTSKQWWKIDELLYCLYERLMSGIY